MSKQLLISLILVVATGLSWWGNSVFNNPHLYQDKQIIKQSPGSYMENFTTRMMNEQGQIVHELSAPYLVHYPLLDRSTIQQPSMRFFMEGRQAWVITAKQGEVLGNGESVVLNGNVHLRQQNGGQAALQLKTEQLKIFPDKNYAETQSGVTIEKDNNIVTATGLFANFKNDFVELHSNVRGTYVPAEQ